MPGSQQEPLRERTILHLDMDAFFASVEQRDHPELRGKPVIIGGDAESRGVVSTCSYEARKFGVHSAMPTAQAKRLCPHGIYLHGNHAKYSAVSRQMFAILSRYTPLIEGLSVDEAFLDVTGSYKLFGDGVTIAERLKYEIRQELDLTASVGVSYNKFLAKLASDLDKPNGLVVVTPADIETRVHPLPITRLWGVGQKSAEQLMRLGLRTIGDVAHMDVTRMRRYLGSLADHLYLLAQGIDERPVQPHREAKSIGQETTFAEDVRDFAFLEATLLAQVETIARRMRSKGVEGRTVTLKLRYAPFRTITRSHTMPNASALEKTLYHTVKLLLAKCGLTRDDAIRLIGVSVSHFTPAGETQQLSLFDDVQSDVKQQDLTKVVDQLKDKFGENVLTRARLVRRDKPEDS
ncbi:MAG: DNA polymerase IV [Tumebacillaceae bacterium]